MDDPINEIYLLYPTAKAIWDAVTLAYSDFEDFSLLFDLRIWSRHLKQNGSSITQYFNLPTKLRQELDLFSLLQWNDPGDSETSRKVVTKEHIYDFLISLNPSLDDILS